MTPSTRLLALAETMRFNSCELWAREADAIAFLVGRLEKSLDQITLDAQEDADNAERAARMKGSNVVVLRGPLGTTWFRRGEFER